MENTHLKTLPFTITPKQQAQLQGYVDLLLKWNKAFNLVGRSTEAEVWQRHIVDAAQLAPLLQGAKTVLDVGCGAGLPAVVLAILGDAHVTACERIHKKTDFIKEVRRVLGLESCLTVAAHDVRDFQRKEKTFDFITARAVAPLIDLIDLTEGLLSPDGRYVFLKGEDAQQEISALQNKYSMTVKTISSITLPTGEIVILKQQ